MVVCGVGWAKSEAVQKEATRIYQALLEQGVDVILDDRGERPGAMFADWELIGVPIRVNVGDRGLKDGQVELVTRRDLNTEKIGLDDAVASVMAAHLAMGQPN